MVLLFSLSHILWVIHILNCPCDARGVEVCVQQHMFLCCALQWAPSIQESTNCFFTGAGCCQIGDIANRAWNDSKADQCVPLACSSYSSCKKKGKYRARNIFHQLLVWPHSMVFIYQKRNQGRCEKLQFNTEVEASTAKEGGDNYRAPPPSHRNSASVQREYRENDLWREGTWRVHISWRSGLRVCFCFKQCSIQCKWKRSPQGLIQESKDSSSLNEGSSSWICSGGNNYLVLRQGTSMWASPLQWGVQRADGSVVLTRLWHCSQCHKWLSICA